MSMTPENATLSWRDLADQLTPEQIEELASEKKQLWAVIENGSYAYRSDTDDQHQRCLTDRARRFARDNLLNALIGPVPPPDGTDAVLEWQDNDDGTAHRFIMGEDRPVTDEITLFTSACQFSDGSIDSGTVEAPAVYIGHDPVPLERVPVMIAALQDCVAELERWSGTGPS
jgi:hypothetical protein